MNGRQFARMLLVTSALVAGGCSADASRFGDFYANAAPAGAVPPGLDYTTTSSIGSGPRGTALVPGAAVDPRAAYPQNGFPQNGAAPSASAPRVVARADYPPATGIDRRSTGSIARSSLPPLAPKRSSASDAGPIPLPPASETGAVATLSAGSTGTSPVYAASAERSKTLAERVRQIVPVRRTAERAPRRVAAVEVPRTEALDRVVSAEKRGGGWTSAGGTRVTIGQGETLYNLSKRYGVPVVSIMDANGISDPTTVRLGQAIVIPTYVYSKTASVSAPDDDPNVRASSAGRGMLGEVSGDAVPPPSLRPRRGAVAMLNAAPAQTPSIPVSAPASSAPVARTQAAGAGSVVVQSGDTLYAIARRTGASVESIKAANGMSANGIAIGQTLRIPGATTQVASAPPVDQIVTASVQRTQIEPARPAPVVEAAPVAKPADLPRVMAPKSEPQPATAPSEVIAKADPVEAPQSTSAGKLRWPVKGRVIGAFGGASKGVDIAVPPGSPVRAAENGTVIYAGSGLKQYGKTVLIQHADGLVTVYGHADTLNVAKGQKVSRGDVIAASGMTGEAASPRVHFQVRKGSSPVDPSGYLN